MQIVDIAEDTRDGWRTLSATVVWERQRRESQKIYYSTPEAHAGMVSRTPDPFLCSTVMAAAYELENRVAFEDPVCPILLKGVRTALEYQQTARRDFRPIPIEAPTTDGPRSPMTTPTSGAMFSGGLDSLATLQNNRRSFGHEDNDYFRYGVVLSAGFDAFEIAPGTAYWSQLEEIAKSADLELIPVKTNVRTLQPADHFFLTYLFGPLLASLGHFLAGGLTRVAIGSAGTLDREVLHGSHPDVDPLFSSGALTVIHDLDTTTRLEKSRSIADWPAVPGKLRVCLRPPQPGQASINCGECEKCVRTMLTFLALNRLDEMELFEPREIDPEFIRTHVILSQTTLPYYAEIADALGQAGFDDLEWAVRERIHTAQTSRDGLTGAVKSLDRRLLGGRLRRLWRRARRR